MKQTQTRVGEEAVAYSLARRKAATVTRESGEVAACFLAREKATAVAGQVIVLYWFSFSCKKCFLLYISFHWYCMIV